MTDVTQALKDAENSLRDFISYTLTKSLGYGWESQCGVAEERFDKWKERKEVEGKRQASGAVEERLIYYADFYDLKTILKKNWSGAFSEAFGEWKTMEVMLGELEKLRDPDAHRRELLQHQKHLILGISGEIRTKIVRYRSNQENHESYFPRIESVRDNFGNIWTLQDSKALLTKMSLHPGDLVEFIVSATDPLGEQLEYGIEIPTDSFAIHWQLENVLAVCLEKKHIFRDFIITLHIRTNREYHATPRDDDSISFMYHVLP